MSAEAAARMGDEIAHGFGLAAMIAGAVAGAVVGAAIVAATAATGGLAAVIIAGAVAGGGLAAGQIMSGLTTIFNLPEPTSGVVATGSPNVLTNMRPAVRALLDVAGCTGIPLNHPPLPMPVPLVEGSATVLINNMPASRLKSKLMCGAHMKSGSNNVIIGGETARVGFVFDLEAWMKTGLEVLGIGALIGGALFAIAAGVVASAGFAAITAGGMAVFEGVGQIGDALGPGYRDLLQGVLGMGLLVASPRLARTGEPTRPVPEGELPSPAPRPPPDPAAPPAPPANTPAPRLPQDVAVDPVAPDAKALNRPVGSSPTQNAEVQADIARAQADGGADFRVNQQQVDAAGNRVGTNRPDLQYTDANGQRVYVEYDRTSSTRGPGHEARILSNDPNGRVILKTVD